MAGKNAIPKGRSKGKKNSSKNPLKARLDGLEKAQKDGMLRLAQDVVSNRQVLEQFHGVLANMDITLATCRALLIEHTDCTEEIFEAKFAEIRNKKLELSKAHEEQQRKIQAMGDAWMKEGLSREEVIAIFQEANRQGADPELIKMKRASVRAGNEQSWPDGAQIFGG